MDFPPVFCLFDASSPAIQFIFAMNDATTSLLTEHFSYTPLVSFL